MYFNHLVAILPTGFDHTQRVWGIFGLKLRLSPTSAEENEGREHHEDHPLAD